MIEKLAAIKDRFMYLEEQLSDPDVISDMDRYRKVNREYKELKPIIEAFSEYTLLVGNIQTAQQMAREEKDPDLKEMASEELAELLPQKENLEEKIKQLLIPKDPEDAKDVILEIRAGTGGDEASLFAGDLYRMYAKFFAEKGWKTEVLSTSEGAVGGFKEIVLEVYGESVYGQLKFESGAHRVQRIPKTESQGRVHTSAATVAVIPKVEEEEINIRKEDLRVDVFRASGAGGQHVNRTESAVRMVHIPTGIVGESQDSRSQIKNREIALQRLYVKLMDKQRDEQMSSLAAQRRSLVGSGDRSEKIRTYNYPQNRVTDHRLEGDVKNFNLEQVVEGQLEGVIEALQLAENAEKLKSGGDQE
ncbi:MAG: peptide chain release factor 1 [Lewinellaceae bacterium]|nr:peptide chain release factor 1 [Lewinella sp.]MCB9280131.1 peptide chain release factor 1 [Lewinellaceae bacterium]